MSNTLNGLLTASAVRQRCHAMAKLADQGQTEYFKISREALPDCVDLVVEECLSNYPQLDIPYHSRWRHFVVGHDDLWQYYADTRLKGSSQLETAKTAIDLVFVSVLLDAGAGADWQYRDPVSGQILERSEGLAAASIDLFFNGLLANDDIALTVSALRQLDQAKLAVHFQASQSNPLIGLDGRLHLLHNLAEQMDVGSKSTLNRPGDLIDVFQDQLVNGELSAATVLQEVLIRFNKMWPSGLQRTGVFLGDCGFHSKLATDDDTQNLVPFHKLSQWLTYSLIEPLQWAGFTVVDLDALTGLPEYRNGGLFLDCGVLSPYNSRLLESELNVTSEPVVEWRALTVYLLDLVADGVRHKLNKSRSELPLASILQGGTWSAGRKLASEKRNGIPPIKLAIDGTIF